MKGIKYKQSMLEYSKIILTKMSFSKALFRKEYKKAIDILTVDERGQLENWARLQWKMMFN
ncbi:MAG TPA: hypothetical protein PKD30_05920 [Saprospiraceae bacterium]|nr:hypothetical protein [Saprospiraceae bacterium]